MSLQLLVREKAVSGANKIFRAEAPRGQAKVNCVDDAVDHDDDVVDNDDVDIYIMMKCVSVCHEKSSLPPGSLL